MLGIAISLLFGFAAYTALISLQHSLLNGARAARRLMAELAAMERPVSRPVSPPLVLLPASRPRLAAA